MASECSNGRIINFTELEAVREEEVEEEKELHLMEEQDKSQVEVAQEADKSEMLVIRRTLSGL